MRNMADAQKPTELQSQASIVKGLGGIRATTPAGPSRYQRGKGKVLYDTLYRKKWRIEIPKGVYEEVVATRETRGVHIPNQYHTIIE